MPDRSSRLQRNCPYWTCFSKLSNEDMLVRASIDAERNHVSPELFFASHFSTLLGQKFLEKGSLTKTCQEFVTPLALLLLC